MAENYMDRFTTPEEFIRAEVLANRGSDNVADKAELLEICKLRAGNEERLDNLTKAQLFDRIVDLYGPEAYSMFSVGVSSICLQEKFDITHKDVLKLAKAGVLTVTGKRKFRKYGKYLYANLYSAYDYFGLSAVDIQKHLATL